MKLYGLVERGIGKKESEDRVLIGDTILAGGYFEMEQENDLATLMAVADGVGGNKAGETAATMAVDGIRLLNRKDTLEAPDIIQLMTKLNDNILTASAQNSDLYRMATTLSGVVLLDNQGILFHVGNTRVYTYAGYLQQKTVDHTTANMLYHIGLITKEEADNYENKNEIDACLGGGNQEYARKLIVEARNDIVANNTNLILTSDGIHDYVGIDQMEELLSVNGNAKQIMESIAKAARDNGSEDDISLIIFDRKGLYTA